MRSDLQDKTDVGISNPAQFYTNWSQLSTQETPELLRGPEKQDSIPSWAGILIF